MTIFLSRNAGPIASFKWVLIVEENKLLKPNQYSQWGFSSCPSPFNLFKGICSLKCKSMEGFIQSLGILCNQKHTSSTGERLWSLNNDDCVYDAGFWNYCTP